MVPLRSALAALLVAAAAPAAAVELAQNSPINNAPITNAPELILPPAALLPDLVLSLPITTTAVCNADKTVTITIKATFKNTGKAPVVFAAQHTVASSTYGYATGKTNLVDPTNNPPQPVVKGPLTVAAGASHQVTIVFSKMSRYKPMRTPGKYVASAFINPLDQVPESNPNNNGSGNYVNDPCFGM
jgi:hypothetical protein